MKQANTRLGTVRTIRSPVGDLPRDSEGILVQEDELGTATAQRLFKMRCECGRSWFELELKMLVKCPACSKLDRVHEF
jgi:hypothetical protein